MNQEIKRKLFKNKYLSFNNQVFINSIKSKLKKKINPFKRITKIIKRRRKTKLYFFRHFHFIKRVKKYQKRKAFKALFIKLKENNTLLSSPNLKTRPISFTTNNEGKSIKKFTIQKKRKNKWSFVRFYRYGQKLKAFRKLKLKKFTKINFFNILKAKYNLIKKKGIYQDIPSSEKMMSYKVTKYKPYKYRRFFKSSLHTYNYQFVAKQLLNKVYGGINKNILTEISKNQNLDIKKNRLLLSILETRLDVLLFRMGFTNSLFESQQLISYGFVYVDNKPITVKDFYVKPNSIIKIKHISQPLKNHNTFEKIQNFLLTNNKNLSFYFNELNRINKLIALHKKKTNLIPLIKIANNKLRLKANYKSIITYRKIKDLLFLIKIKLKQKIKFSYLKLLSYLWLIYKPLYNAQTLGNKKITSITLLKKKKKLNKFKFNQNKRIKLKKIIKLIKRLLILKKNKQGIVSLRSFMPNWSLFKRINLKPTVTKYIKPLNLKQKTYKYPKYLQINFKTKTAILLQTPKLEQIPLSFKVQNKLNFINQYLKIA